MKLEDQVENTQQKSSQPIHIIDPPFHCWFGLSYSSYLVLPRLILEHMPRKWQLKMIALINQIPKTIEIDEKYHDEYNITCKKKGKFYRDPYRDYRRGTVKYKE